MRIAPGDGALGSERMATASLLVRCGCCLLQPGHVQEARDGTGQMPLPQWQKQVDREGEVHPDRAGGQFNNSLTSSSLGIGKRGHYERGLFAGGISRISKFSRISRKWPDSP